MKKNTVLTVFLLALFFNAMVSAQEKKSPIKPNQETVNNNKWEVWTDKVPVSGNVRVGLMFDSDENNLNPEHFFARIPEVKLTTNLCVEISSKDGRYSAKRSYTITPTDDDVQEFFWPTKYKKALSAFKTEELVILASLSDDCNSKPDAYVISSWNSIPSDVIETRSVSVYVNSISSTSLIVDNDTGGSIKCSDLESPMVAYNKKGTIPDNKVKDTSTIVIKQMRRRGPKVSFVKYELSLKYSKN
ncbi:hypothetical protein Q4Q35_07490 [Flavivirga aquimarina]|uniref:Uncharacterized protein n=1 Tax=Flavivirga aquimarina TaxID=2027862 RepID=A0ABT8W965_9FLAO|nr:hypothetical protein [Flavivirga aquimarina]MDO5969646.1 hypothetical protein [Flavivirga aquimarina]